MVNVNKTFYNNLDDETKKKYKKPPEDSDNLCNIIGKYYNQRDLLSPY